ncbi:DNA polymerase I [Gammaproteobacteria bacterium]
MKTPGRLVLIDGSSYLFRAFHALPPLSNSKGEPTGAVVGVLQMIQRLLDDEQPDHLAVVFDAGGPTFRHALYPDYKAHRPPVPPDLRVQIEPLQAIVSAWGLPLLKVPGVEADDVMATLARRAASQGWMVLIVSSDKDLAQLVNDQISLLDTMKETRLDRAGVISKFGVPPERMGDFLALTGDTADNVPGVPGCGPKTAARWLADFGSLDHLVARADEVKGKAGENLRASLTQLSLSRQLVALQEDLPLVETPEDLVRRAPEVDILRGWFERLESRRLMAALDAVSPPTPAPPEMAVARHYETILTMADLERWVARLETANLAAIDTETTHLEALRAELVGLSFAVKAGEAAYLPVGHCYPGVPDQLPREVVLARLKPWLEDPRRAKVGQHLKYDLNVLARYGIEMGGLAFDTLLESYVLDSTLVRHDLDALARRYLGRTNITFESVTAKQSATGKSRQQIGFAEVPLEQATPYAAEDAEVTLALHQHLWPRLQAVPSQAALLQDLEMPLVPVLARMERQGVRIDSQQLEHFGQELARRMDSLALRAYRAAGMAFNLASPKQIGEILYDRMKLPVRVKTPGGVPSTSEEVLQTWADEGHALSGLILEHRGLAKLKSTYADKLPRMVNPETGRIHTSYHQAVAATGRLSSSDPNLQNIPARTEEGRRIRRAFVATEGWRLLAADYSQIELRLMAHFSGDAALLRAFEAGLDIHRATAAEVAGQTVDQVTPDQRRAAKAINFGLIYGMSAFGLARQLGIDRRAAQVKVDRYFQRYPGVSDFMTRMRDVAKTQGYVETLFGRRLYLPDLKSRNQGLRAAAERTAINAPLQGTAADLIKRAMIALDQWILSEKPPVRMIMQVHDELVFEVTPDFMAEATDRIRHTMEQAPELRVPLVVEIGTGDHWDEAH